MDAQKKAEYMERLNVVLCAEMDKPVTQVSLENVKNLLKVRHMLTDVDIVEKSVDKFDTVDKDNLHKMAHTILDELTGYLMYKNEAKTQPDTSNREMMLDELKHMMKGYKEFLYELYTTSETREEREIVKQTIKEIKNMFPIG